MTKRELFTNVAAGIINEETIAAAQEELQKLEATNEKRKEKAKEKTKENQPIVDRIVDEILTTEPMTASDVAAILEVKVQKASALCRAAVAQGKAVQSEIKVPKKGTQKAYSLPN